MHLTFNLNQPLAHVQAQLSDMQQFAAIHPVISRIDATEGNSYLVHETLKLGFIPISFRYPVTVVSTPDTVSMQATVMRWTKIEMVFRLRQEPGHTVVDEEIAFRSPLPVRFIIARIFRKQHTQLFKNMESSSREEIKQSFM